MKFTLRDLFWLTLVTALAVGWLVDHAHSSRRLQRVLDGQSRNAWHFTEASDLLRAAEVRERVAREQAEMMQSQLLHYQAEHPPTAQQKVPAATAED